MAENKNAKKVQLTPEMAQNLFQQQRQALNNLVQKKGKIEQALMGLDSTLANMEALEDNDDSEGMLHLGSGVYISVDLPKKVKKVRFNVGNDIVLDSDLKEVKGKLETRKENLTKEHSAIISQEKGLSENLNKLYMYLTKANAKK